MRKLSLVVMGAVVGAGTATLVSQTQLLSGTSAIAAQLVAAAEIHWSSP